MERFTLKSYNDKYIIPSGHLSIDGELAQKLGVLEDAEERGRLYVAPFRIGAKVWNLSLSFAPPIETRVEEYFVNEFNELVIILENGNRYRAKDIGKTVFLTEAEARQALEKSIGGEND